jgi:hypothetical protein
MLAEVRRPRQLHRLLGKHSMHSYVTRGRSSMDLSNAVGCYARRRGPWTSLRMTIRHGAATAGI